jgi:hypothetical protein
MAIKEAIADRAQNQVRQLSREHFLRFSVMCLLWHLTCGYLFRKANCDL